MAKKRKNVADRKVERREDDHDTLWRSSIVAASTSLPLWAPAIRGMHVVYTDQVKTMGVDKYWRCYVNIEFMYKLRDMARAVSPQNPCKACGADYHHDIAYIAGVIAHEASHLLRSHMTRAQDQLVVTRFLADLWNIAADMEINDDLMAMFKDSTRVKGGLCLPPLQFPSDKSKPEELDMVLTPKCYSYEDSKLVEEYYWKLKEEPEHQCGNCGGTGKVPAGQGIESMQGQGQGQGGQNGKDPGQQGQGQGQGQGQQGQDPGQGGGGGNDPSQQGQGPGQGQGGAQASGQEETCPCCGGTGKGSPYARADSGSGADGLARDWDQGEPDDDHAPGLSEIEQRMIRKEVAKNISESARKRGNVPGGWRRWADETLGTAKYDWRKELKKVIGRTMHTIPGDRFRSYKRLSRRCSSLGHKVILPSMHDTTPQICIIQDTSGSMGEDNMRIALEETQGLLKAAQCQISYINCDAAADKVQKVQNVSQIDLYGGGGTDMRVGVKAALESYPEPDVMILFTDGWTPWPESIPRGKQLVVCLVGQSACQSNEVPSWCRVVKIVDEVEDVR